MMETLVQPGLPISVHRACPTIAGCVPSASTFMWTPSKLLVATSYSARNASVRHILVPCVTSRSLVNLNQIFLSEDWCWSYRSLVQMSSAALSSADTKSTSTLRNVNSLQLSVQTRRSAAPSSGKTSTSTRMKFASTGPCTAFLNAASPCASTT